MDFYSADSHLSRAVRFPRLVAHREEKKRRNMGHSISVPRSKESREMGIDELRQDPMMAHLMASLDKGRDIGHYGRLVFVMIARHFLTEQEILDYLMKDRNVDERKARSLLTQVKARNYNPPRRERVLDWMSRQKFPICPEPADPDQCNVYKNLNFPKEIYDKIQDFYKGKADSQS
jgi:hypothetical protein